MLALGFGFWEDWELQDNVIFDMFRRLIIVNPGVAVLDVKSDVYSAWKRWMLIDDNNKIGQVIRVIGGDATVQGQKAGDIYFLVNGWRLQADLSQTAIVGSIFSDDFASPVVDFSGNLVFQSLVSSLVTGVDTETPATAGDIAQQVWDMQQSLALITGSFGEAIQSLTNEIVKVQELHRLQGLDPENPMNVTTGSRTAGDIQLTITGDGVNTSTVTRGDAIPPSNIVDSEGDFLVDELGNFIVG